MLTASRDELDLKDQASVRTWFAANRPDAVLLAAAKVGGILANDSLPADFLYDNLMIEANVIDAAHRERHRKAAVPRLELHLSESSPPSRSRRMRCSPARLSRRTNGMRSPRLPGSSLPNPIGVSTSGDFISAMPTNLYGPGDNFDLDRAMSCPR
jgi:GDP-L-fucose synthase